MQRHCDSLHQNSYRQRSPRRRHLFPMIASYNSRDVRTRRSADECDSVIDLRAPDCFKNQTRSRGHLLYDHIASLLFQFTVKRSNKHRNYEALKSGAFPDTSSPMISPKSPNTELNISMTSTLTKLCDVSIRYSNPSKLGYTYRLGSAASANAALLPLIPTETPHIRLHIPTVIPDQNNAYPVYSAACQGQQYCKNIRIIMEA